MTLALVILATVAALTAGQSGDKRAMAVHNVATISELTAVLGKLESGDTVLLAPGDYGKLSFWQKNFQDTVTIAAAPGPGKVHFDGIGIGSSSNITLIGLDVGRGLADGEPEYTKLSNIFRSQNIKFVGLSVHGSQDGNVNNDGIGIFVEESENVEILSNRFDELFRGVLIEGSSAVTVSGGRFEEMRSDGINAAGSDRVTIRGNIFQAFNRFGTDHADAIQLWNVGQPKGSTDIVIRDNVFLPSSDGKGAQGIFISDNEQHKFKNVLIQNNLMYGNDDYNGITVTNAENVRVLGNTVLSSSTNPKRYWIRLENSENVTLAGNVADHLLVTPDISNFRKDNNLFLSDNPGARSRFLDLDSPTVVHDLIIPGLGYQLPEPGAVSKVLGSSLLGAMGQGQGQGLSALQEAVLADLDLGGAGQGLVFNSAHGSAALTHAPAVASGNAFAEQPVAVSPVTLERFWSLEHFVALP